nr:myosin-9-like isoform X1 [Ipomoea batatas]
MQFSSEYCRANAIFHHWLISCAGYPSRKTFSEFLKRFGILAPEALKGTYDEKDACKKILGGLDLVSRQTSFDIETVFTCKLIYGLDIQHLPEIGKTKVFLRASEMMELEAKRLQKLSSAAKIIQGQIKTRTARRDFLALQRAAISIQSSCRVLVILDVKALRSALAELVHGIEVHGGLLLALATGQEHHSGDCRWHGSLQGTDSVFGYHLWCNLGRVGSRSDHVGLQQGTLKEDMVVVEGLVAGSKNALRYICTFVNVMRSIDKDLGLNNGNKTILLADNCIAG